MKRAKHSFNYIWNNSCFIKNMNYIIFFLLTLTTLQANYNITIKGPFDSNLYDVTQDYNDDISVVGFTQNYHVEAPKEVYHDIFSQLASQNKSEGEQIRLMRLNQTSGAIEYDFETSLPQFNRAVALVKSINHSYFVGGYTQNGKLLLLKVNDKRRITHKKIFGTSNFSQMSKLTALRDGGVLAIGSSMTTRDRGDDIFEQGLGLNDFFVTRFDKNANMLWSRKYGTEFDDRGICATEAYDGSIIIAGTTDEKAKRTLTLLRISERGDKIWQRRYTDSKVNDVHDIIRLKNQTFLIALSYYNSLNKKQARLINFDLQENILASENIIRNSDFVIKAIKEASNQTLIAVGYTTDTINANSDGVALHLTNGLKLLWEKKLGGKNYDAFENVAILKDGSFVAVGQSSFNGSEVENMWVVKLSRYGKVSGHTHTSIYKELEKNFAKEIKSEQLLLKKDLSLTLYDSTLHFDIGVSTLNTKQKNLIKSIKPRLLKILDHYHDRIENLSINGHTSSVWNDYKFEKRYLKNMKLSTERAYNTLEVLFKSNSKKDMKLLSELLQSSGNAYKKTIIKKGKEDKKASQRVVIQIELKE